MQKTELRRAPRRKIDPLPVSIVHPCQDLSAAGLNFGKILDVSTAGVRIQVTGRWIIDVGTPVELICLPKKGTNPIGLQATAPRLRGAVIWQNDVSGQIGVAFTS